MTNKNKPKVISVTGNVRITNIGFINKFNNPKTIATIIAVVKLATCTPGKKFEINNTKAAVTRSLSNSFIIYGLKFKIKVVIFMVSNSNYSFKNTVVNSKNILGFSACSQCPASGIVSNLTFGKWVRMLSKSESKI